MKKIIIYILVLILSVSLIGCTSNETDNTPKNIEENSNSTTTPSDSSNEASDDSSTDSTVNTSTDSSSDTTSNSNSETSNAISTNETSTTTSTNSSNDSTVDTSTDSSTSTPSIKSTDYDIPEIISFDDYVQEVINQFPEMEKGWYQARQLMNFQSFESCINADELLNSVFGWEDKANYSALQLVETDYETYYICGTNKKVGWYKKYTNKNKNVIKFMSFFNNDEELIHLSYDVSDDDTSNKPVKSFKMHINTVIYNCNFSKTSPYYLRKIEYSINEGVTTSEATFYENGNLLSVSTNCKAYDTCPLIMAQFYENGKLLRTHFEFNNKNQGPYREYYEDMTLKNVISFDNGLMNGPYISYFPNGQIEKLGSYNNDKQTGRWIYFKENGEIHSDQTIE